MTALGIVNQALRRIGDRAITSFSDDSTGARASLAFFKTAMDEVVSEYEWSFARKRAALVADESTENLTSYDYMYDRPSDAIRVLAVTPETQYEVEAGKIYSDGSDLVCLYTRSMVDDITEEDPRIVPGATLPTKFVMACSLRLASHIALALNKSDYLGVVQSEYTVMLAQAKNQDAMETPGLDDDPEHWDEVT